MMRSPKRHRITKEDSGENSLRAETTGPTAPSCGGRSKELRANPGRRQRMRASPLQEHLTQADCQQFQPSVHHF